jgi:hypothetical protein
MNPRYAFIAARAGHRCEYCHAPEVIFNFPFEVEHVIPPAKAGSDNEENWALACRSCNLFKSDGLEAMDGATGMTVPLFHPRQDVWDEHFGAAVDEGTILGQSATGRATIIRLRMNSPTQVVARKQWARLGLFP